jgi:hypothetical protein
MGSEATQNMLCPSCGKPVQENNSFCPSCGRPITYNAIPQSTSQSPPPPPQSPQKNSFITSRTGRNFVVGLVILFLAIVVILSASSYMNSLNSTTTHVTNIVNGMATVNSNSYQTYTFTVPSGASNIAISGSFTASGGSGNDIKVLVLEQSDFTNWANGHTASCYYQSGQTTTGTISASLPTSGTYVLVYDNMFSLFSQKNVSTKVDLSYIS